MMRYSPSAAEITSTHDNMELWSQPGLKHRQAVLLATSSIVRKPSRLSQVSVPPSFRFRSYSAMSAGAVPINLPKTNVSDEANNGKALIDGHSSFRNPAESIKFFFIRNSTTPYTSILPLQIYLRTILSQTTRLTDIMPLEIQICGGLPTMNGQVYEIIDR